MGAHESLYVYMNGYVVGVLKKSSGDIIFVYDSKWLEKKDAIPISLSMPLRETPYRTDLSVFENLLPDSPQLRRRLAEKTQALGHDPYSLLSTIGKDCVGAMQFLPAPKLDLKNQSISGEKIGEKKISTLLKQLKNFPLGSFQEDFRISIAGAQEKTALLWWNKAWHIPAGSTPTTHILKPQIGIFENGWDLSQSVENEYFCLQFARAAGFNVATSQIHDFDQTRTLVVERFDRLWTPKKRLLRLPQEDFCQVLSIPSSQKYESDGGPGVLQILEALKGSDSPNEDRLHFFKSLVLFWLLGATDGHAKNFSIHLLPGGRFRLTPLYDIMSAQPLFDSGQLQKNKFKLAMSLGKNRHYVVDTVSPRHFLQSAHEAGLSSNLVHGLFKELLVTIPQAIAITPQKMPIGFPKKISASIIRGVKSRLKTLRDYMV